jgi:hypothetical protein
MNPLHYLHRGYFRSKMVIFKRKVGNDKTNLTFVLKLAMNYLQTGLLFRVKTKNKRSFHICFIRHHIQCNA